ncbi:MAG: AMP-binding protein [Burkholderiaceae bacterium]
MAAIRYYDWIAHHAGHQPGKLAVRELESGRAFSYAELHQRCGRLASALAALGVARGDRVAILAQNGVETFELQFAAARLGAIVLPLNWRLTVPELSYIIGDSTPSVLVHDVEFADTALALHRECGIRTLLSLNHRAPNEGGYEQALAEAPTMVALPPEDVMHDDLAMIMYTSGTTGHPKGAMITHGMVFWNCVNLGVPAAITPRTVQLVVLPLFHTGGLNCYANPVLHAGGSLVIQRAFDPGAALAAIGDRSLGITHFFAVPAPYQFMMQHPDFPGTDLSRLEVAGVGGAPCPLAVLEQWQARHVPLVQGMA